MVKCEDGNDEYVTIFKSLCSGSSPQQYEDVQLELLKENHPLAPLLETKFCPLPCILASSPQQRNEAADDSEVADVDESVDSYEGSPLRPLGTPDVLRDGRSATNQPLYWPVSVDKARLLVSMYNLHITPAEDTLPLYVICDGKDAEGLVVLGTSKRTSSSGEPEIHMFTANVKGPITSKTKFPLPGAFAKELGFSSLNAVEAHCTASFDVYKSSLQENSSSGQQGSLQVLCDWRTLTPPLQIPFLDAATVVEAHVFPGDVKSAAHSLYMELFLLKGLVCGLDDGTVYWYTTETEVSVLDRLRQYFTRLGQPGSGAVEKADNEQVSSAIEQLIVAIRQDLDFTEDLWNILKDCQCYQDLVDAFHLLVKTLTSGSYQPAIHSTSQSRLAAVLRRSYTDPAALTDLRDLRPLEVLAEIGLEKVTKDHIHHLVSNELVSLAQLEQFLATGSTLQERIVLLEQLHYAVELAVSLDQFLKLPKQAVSYGAREVLKYFGDHALEKKALVFRIPVQKKNVNNVLAGLQPAEWRASLSSKQTTPQEHAVVLLSPEPPFPHAQQTTMLTNGDDESLDTESCYYQTNVFHHVLCM